MRGSMRKDRRYLKLCSFGFPLLPLNFESGPFVLQEMKDAGHGVQWTLHIDRTHRRRCSRLTIRLIGDLGVTAVHPMA